MAVLDIPFVIIYHYRGIDTCWSWKNDPFILSLDMPPYYAISH
jgi:hypothetical protein